ncbi:PTS transporter subunit EIIC [Streptococcus moroccensis]|uniref:PTS system sucrose-specific IIC component n=2 Tax=Streptococcus moroccensis TaxID=1451356 RepID=A0ABT9YQ46_9STRE|nr:PTS system sucrose-specific IIC component [Streptococcus moroccensis]
MDYKDLANRIIVLSGGRDNFIKVFNCMTRVRINYRDIDKVKKEEIKQLPGVLGIIEDSSFQIIVGPGKSTKLQEAINQELQLEVVNEELVESSKNQGFLKTLSNIFVPVLPAIIASGFLQGINNVLVNLASDAAKSQGIIGTETLSQAQVMLQNWNLFEVSTVLGILGNAAFGFLAIYTGITAAKEFKTDMIMGGLVGAMTLSPNLSLINLAPGRGGLFGVILGVWLLSIIDRQLKKWIPDVIDVVIRPTLSLLLTAIIYFVVIMPIAGLLTDLLTNGILFIIETAGVVGGFVLASLAPLLISTGLHHGLNPINIELINSTGSTPISAIQIMSNAGLVGSGLALYLLTKRTEIKETAKGVIPATFLAVGEPTMYGLVIPSGFGFVTASIGAGFGGMMIRLLDVKLSAMGAAGMSAIPLVADGKYLQYLISYAVGLTAAFALTYAVGKYKKFE